MLTAEFSACGQFRHKLLWIWDESRPVMPWVLFNPSQAGKVLEGEARKDPTATKVRGFSERLGCGGAAISNPYDYIATFPKDLKKAGYPISPENDRHILEVCAMGDGRVICAWGALGRKLSRPVEVLSMIRAAGFRPHALGFTEDRLPRHPLMLAYETPLEAF